MEKNLLKAEAVWGSTGMTIFSRSVQGHPMRPGCISVGVGSLHSLKPGASAPATGPLEIPVEQSRGVPWGKNTTGGRDITGSRTIRERLGTGAAGLHAIYGGRSRDWACTEIL